MTVDEQVPVPPGARGYDSFLAAGGSVGRTLSRSRPRWREQVRAPEASPNIVLVVFDDLGFADLSPYGSEIDTPTIDRLARNGVRLTNYHTTPLCSPSRAALLTGLNPHRAGFAYPANADPGYPSYAFELPENAPTVAESLRAAGYATFAVGKWHLTGDRNLNDAADRSSWPVQRGFDRYFGSLEGFTSLHHPHRLMVDNSPWDVDEFPDGYFLTDDLTDRAIGMIRDLRAADDQKPFFLYFAHHAVHGPIQAKAVDLDRARGAYDEGWDVIRQRRFERQVADGIFPPGTRLPPANHEPGKDVRPWDDLTPQEQQRFARYMEVYAASVANVDANLARLYAVLEQYGEADNTIVVVTSDNGATAEGGAEGTRSYFSQFAHVHGLPADWVRDVDRDADLIGGPRTTVHYPRGWGQASNTPFRLYKSDTFEGGIRAPFVVHWPAGGLRPGRADAADAPTDNGIRDQFVYVTDVPQTLLDLAGIPRAAHRQHLPAADPDGGTAAAILRDPGAPAPEVAQYTETAGNRGFFRGRWKIVTQHRPGASFDDTEWELYDLADDPTETTNLADEHPEVLADLAAEWERHAWRNSVFPLNDHGPAFDLRRPSDERFARPVTFYPGTTTVERYRSAQLIAHRDFRVIIALHHHAGAAGVLLAHGDQGGGYSVVVGPDGVRVTLNAYGDLSHSAAVPLPTGEQAVELTVQARPAFRWDLRLSTAAGDAALLDRPQLLGMAPFTGISVGADKGGPVDWELSRTHGSHPYSGVVHSVRYEPGPPSPDSPAELARLWADAARIYD